MAQPRLPYFDVLLAELNRHNPSIEKSFGRHAHWGYWPDPAAARGDDDDYAAAAEALAEELCRLADIAEGQRVLDVGCGFGGTIASLNERFADLRLAGINIDGRQLARAQRQVRPLAGNTVAFCQADACSLPIDAESVDRVLAVECIFHFPSRERFFAEARRVLRPNGVLALSDFVPSRAFVPATRVIASGWFGRINFFGPCDVGYTVERYRRLARDAGFDVLVDRNVTRHILPTYDYLERQLAHAGAGPPLAGPLIKLQRLIAARGLLGYHLLSFRKR